ncbi:hypothetical protein ACN6KF_003033 [Labrys sp. La1]|uniref:hypothetical protein n=1 Tax=Labrys sp. La1 TaxID=3404917 RepID=UPI003EBE6EC4
MREYWVVYFSHLRTKGVRHSCRDSLLSTSNGRIKAMRYLGHKVLYRIHVKLKEGV